MKRLTGLLALALALVAVMAGCSAGGPPKAVAPQTSYDFGDVPVTADVKHHTFTIANEGTGNLQIKGVEVKLLQGC